MKTEEIGDGPPSSRGRFAPARIARAGEILDLVRRGQATTLAHLSEHLGLARSTVNDRVEALLASGMLTTSEPSGGSRGRPAVGLEFNPRSGTTLAAQLGISGVRIAVTDLAGDILTSEMIEIDLADPLADVLRQVTRAFARSLRELGEDVASVHGIGFGLPARVELAAHAGSADRWTEDTVTAELQQWLDVPVFVDHDVNLLAFGELCARESDPEALLSLKVGTVIGCGLVVNGRVVQGASGMAGEIGHTRVGDSQAPCSCGNVGCLNAVASGAAVARRLREQGVDAPNARAVAELARAGHVEAGRAVRAAGRDIGDVLAGAVNLLNPAAITLWGYLAEAGDQLSAGIREGIARSALSGPAAAVTIEPATLGADAGLYGAAMMVIEQALQPASVDAYLIATRTG
ncbi:ROK family transcriptional regulator [Kribbella sp. NPDC003557]|uniref:ROK family transcriptional regulator n=1 Tax=Kribbella sp. NPDC003557 TaxID=3154449 RepID=UPI0033BEE7CD